MDGRDQKHESFQQEHATESTTKKEKKAKRVVGVVGVVQDRRTERNSSRRS
jgi:hypothetical protein